MDKQNNNKTTKQVNKLQSLYLVVSTLNLQHSLKLLVIFKVAFWDDWPSFIWRRAVFCSTLSTWHHLASIIMRPGFTVPLFYFGGTPLSDMPLPQSVFEITVMFKTKARNFPHGMDQNLMQSSAFTLLPNFTSVTGWNTNHDSMSTVLYRWLHTLKYSCHWLL